MNTLDYYYISSIIEKNLNPGEYKKIDDLMIDCLIDKKSKQANNLLRILQDMEAIGRIVFCGNEIKIIQ